MRDFDGDLTALMNRRNPDIWDQASKLEQIAEGAVDEITRLRALVAELTAALALIANSNTFNGGTWPGELQEIARAALAKARGDAP